MRGGVTMKVVKTEADKFTKLAEVAAKHAASSASWCNYCQPKEPANLKKLLKK